jgi:hypothetical protein
LSLITSEAAPWGIITVPEDALKPPISRVPDFSTACHNPAQSGHDAIQRHAGADRPGLSGQRPIPPAEARITRRRTQ